MSEMNRNELSHIAFIMDGNGRWARRQGLARAKGHAFGVKSLRTMLRHCKKRGINTITVYAFSTENWKRPKNEVEAILRLLDEYLDEYEKNLDEYDMSLHFLGDRSVFEPRRRARMEQLEQLSAGRERHLNIALNYGGRDEIVRACNKLIAKGVPVDESAFSAVLDTAALPDPDLIIRTGGDLRISNFLLWQCAYAELYFTDVLWPDFGTEELDAAIEDFYKRKRRFGGV